MTNQPTDAEWEALGIVAPREAWRLETLTSAMLVASSYSGGWDAGHEEWTIMKRWHRVEGRTSYFVELGWDGYEQSYAGDGDLRAIIAAAQDAFRLFRGRIALAGPPPPGDPLLYAVDGRPECLQPFDHVLDDVTEEGADGVLVHEYRQSEATDIDIDRLLDDVWATMVEWAREASGAFAPFGHDEGAAEIGPLDNEIVRGALHYALGAAVRTSAEMSEAAWTPTGRVLEVSADGSWQWETT